MSIYCDYQNFSDAFRIDAFPRRTKKSKRSELEAEGFEVKEQTF